jgi:hypothetical protein
MASLLAAVDEIATETQLSEGWTYCVLPATAFASIQAALRNTSVTHFHGKRFKTPDEAAYRALLSEARRQIEQADRYLLSFTLLDLTWKNQFVGFMERLLGGSMKLAGVSDETCVRIAQRLFPGLATLQRLTSSFPTGEVMDIDLDSDSFTEKINKLDITVNGRSIEAARILAAAYRAHGNLLFPGSPALGSGGIRVISDTKSLPVQVADVFGNFALSYLFCALGDTSTKRALKASIFSDAFGDLLKDIDPTTNATLKCNDIELGGNGPLTLELGSHLL